MKKELSIEYIPIADLIPYINNSRTHSDDQVLQICASIKEFGFTNSILIDEENGIIAGHGRLLAATKLNLDSVPTVRLMGLTEAQKKAYVIADNQLALNAGWNLELLKIEIDHLKELDFDLNLLGFGDALADMFPEPIQDGLKDEDDVPEMPAEPTTKTGDVWIMGKHRLMCGNSCSFDDMAILMGGIQADVWLTDPPYNVAYEGGTKEKLKIQNDNMSDDNFRQFLVDAYSTANEHIKCGAVFYIWHADSEGFNFRAAAKDTGWKVRQCLIWKKQSMVLGRQDYQWQHEPCLYGWKEGASHLWASDRKQTTILEFNRPSRNAEHPTMKPVELFEYCLLNNTKGGDVVLDSFGGSGTTLIAAEKNNRIARLMELDPKYCDVIVKRWQEFTGKAAVLESTGEQFDELAAR